MAKEAVRHNCILLIHRRLSLRYNEILFMIDTCQANTMYSKFYSPNILATGSSEINENSYSHENDEDIGVAVIDSFTHYVLEFMEDINKTSQITMQDLFNSYDFNKINSHAGVRSDLFRRSLGHTLITDFFGGVAQVEVLPPNNDLSTVPYTSTPELPMSVTPKTSSHGVTTAETYSHVTDLLSVWQTGSGILRAWVSVGFVGLLVGWVAISRST